MTVLIPGLLTDPNPLSIYKSFVPPTTFKLPPAAAVPVKLFNPYPYVGDVFCVPSVLNPTKDLSCQYLRTPVVLS